MIQIRDVFQAKYGRGDELVALFKEAEPLLTKHGIGPRRILTDASGSFFTVVTESEAENLAAYEESLKVFADPEFGPWFQRMMDVVESGSREFYTIQ